jgi:multidrug efflux system outer membrane protein
MSVAMCTLDLNHILAARENRNTAVQSLVATLAQKYLNLRELDEQLEISRQTLATERANLDLTLLRERGGVAMGVAVLQAETLD